MVLVAQSEVPPAARVEKGKQPQMADKESKQSGPYHVERDFTLFQGSGFSNPLLASEMLKSTILDSDWSLTKIKRMEEVRHTVYQDILKVVYQQFFSPCIIFFGFVMPDFLILFLCRLFTE